MKRQPAFAGLLVFAMVLGQVASVSASPSTCTVRMARACCAQQSSSQCAKHCALQSQVPERSASIASTAHLLVLPAAAVPMTVRHVVQTPAASSGIRHPSAEVFNPPKLYLLACILRL